MISCGFNNTHNHPAQDVLDRLFEDGSDVYLNMHIGLPIPWREKAREGGCGRGGGRERENADGVLRDVALHRGNLDPHACHHQSALTCVLTCMTSPAT